MRWSIWKVLLVFSALLMFAFTGELAAQPASLTMMPTGQTIGIDESLDLTATLLDQLDDPVVDSTVTFSVIAGGGGVSSSSSTTNSSGEAYTTYTATGDSARTVTVQGMWVSDDLADTVSRTVDVEVVAKPASLTLTPTGQKIGINEDLDLTATLYDQLGDTLVDSTVTFSILGTGSGSLDPEIDTTEVNGRAYTTYTSEDIEETVRVEVMGVYNAGADTLSDTVDILIDARPASLTLEPDGIKIVLNDEIQLTATLLDQLDQVVPDSTVSFSVISGGGTLNTIDTTEVDGRAYTIYDAETYEGTAEVEAVGIYNAGADTLRDTVDIIVIDLPDQLTLVPVNPQVSVEGDTSEVFTATLSDGGQPVQGLVISFMVLNDLGYVSPASDTTNSYGRVQTTYYADKTAGIDTLVASWTDEGIRLTLTDTSIITVNAGNPYSVNVFPEDTTVVVTEDATIIAKIMDAFGNKVNATDPAQVSFTHSGKGTFGTSSVNADFNIEMAYHTDDSMVQGPPDVITGRLVVSGLQDQSDVYTIGAAPAHMSIYPGNTGGANHDDSVLVVGGDNKYFSVWLWDQYWNRSIWSDYYEGETYLVHLSASEGGGTFTKWSGPIDTTSVEPGLNGGSAKAWYLSSNTAGVYTITATCGDAEAIQHMIQICDEPDSLYLTGDSIGIPAGSDTVLTAIMFDQYGNHCPADDERFIPDTVEWNWETAKGEGDLGDTYIEDNNWKCRYYSYPLDADTAWIWAGYDDGVEDEVTVFSAEPGDFHHFDLTLLNIPPEAVFDDKAYVSDGSVADTAYLNGVMIEAQDNNNIRLYNYNNTDTLTLTLDESSAEASQVVWYVMNLGGPFNGPPVDTVVGLTAPIPPGYFMQGIAAAGACNQVAETVTITATDTAGHSGTSPELTWLPTGVVGFNVALEGGLTTIHAIDDTVNMQVTAIDEFGNTTGVGLPLNVVLSATRPVDFLGGEMQLMDTPVDLFPMVATQEASDLVLRIADYLVPSINGSSDPITVLASGVDEGPVVSSISASFGSGEISYVVAEDGKFTIKVYNKVGMEVGSLVNGAVKRGYYQASLEGLNLSSDIYFVVMQGPGINKKIKATLIK